MKSCYVSLVFCFLLGWLGYVSPGLSQEEQPSLNDTSNNRETVVPESKPRLNAHPRLIVGFWRGFHEVEEMTLYYGYQFRPNGTFSARHRLYEGEKTLEDNFWQGQWTFDGEILRVQGNNQSNPQKPLNIEFRLAEDLQLYYQNRSLVESYFPVRLGKVQ